MIIPKSAKKQVMKIDSGKYLSKLRQTYLQMGKEQATLAGS